MIIISQYIYLASRLKYAMAGVYLFVCYRAISNLPTIYSYDDLRFIMNPVSAKGQRLRDARRWVYSVVCYEVS
jgi:hypothetical protein